MVSFSSRITSHSVIAAAEDKRSGAPVMASSPQNSSGPRIATTASFPCSDVTVTLTLPLWM